MLIQYIRKNQQPIGCIVAFTDDQGKIRQGISLCNSKDRFDKKIAVSLAIARANKSAEKTEKSFPGWTDSNGKRHMWIPESKKKFVEEAYNKMLQRCSKHYS